MLTLSRLRFPLILIRPQTIKGRHIAGQSIGQKLFFLSFFGNRRAEAYNYVVLPLFQIVTEVLTFLGT